MANEIYHKSNWGSPEKDGWGDVYFNPSATNKLYTRSDNYENEEGTDKALASKPDTQSVLMTPTAYSVGSMNSILPPYELSSELVTNGDFATDSDWAKGTGWSISNEVANVNNISANHLSQDGIVSDNNTYAITFTILNYSSGSIRLRLGNTYGGYTSGNGTYTQYIQCTASDKFRVYSSPSGANLSIDNVSVKEVRNADFTFDRNSTATRVNKEGLIETVAIDTPRLDYPFIDGVVQSEPSLLLEPSSTNVVRYSQDFSQSSWNINDVSIESGYLAPDGTNSAYKITKTGSNAHLVDTSSGGHTATKSIYAKTTSGTGTILLFNNVSTYFTITEEWQRFDAQQDGLDFFYAADFRKVSTLTEIIIWGAQSEALTYPTSYIPTSGSAVTRAAETANGAGTSDDFNDSEGVLYVEPVWDTSAINIYIGLHDGSSSNRILIYSTSTTNIICLFQVSGVTQASFTISNQNSRQFNKIALKYKENDFSFWINGYELGTDTSGSVFSSGTLDELEISPFSGRVKEIAAFKEALTDSELEALTSWDSFSDMATGQEYSIR